MNCKTGMTYEEHRELGDKLQAILRDLPELGNKYNRTSRAVKLARRAAKAIDALRCEMDNLACAESPKRLYPDREPHKLYYGKATVWL